MAVQDSDVRRALTAGGWHTVTGGTFEITGSGNSPFSGECFQFVDSDTAEICFGPIAELKALAYKG